MWRLLVIAGLVGALSAEGVRSKRQAGGQSYSVAFVLTAPYVQESSSGEYEGFIPDLLDAVSERLEGVDFNLQEKDTIYGQVQDGNLTGMLGKVQREEVDLAAGPITITASREALLDFSKPFMSSGIIGLVQRPQRPYSTNKMFAYLRPFSAGAWVVLLLCTVLAGVLLYVNTKYHPKEQEGRAKRPSIGGEGRRLADAFWWIMRSFALQGAENRPKSISGRVICIVWILFILDSLFLYAATLIHNIPAYYGPTPAPTLPFDDMEGLVESDYQYGTVAKTSTAAFFANSQVDLYKKMNRNMVMVDSMEEALLTVQEGKFVYFLESIQADFYMSKDCSLQTTSSMLNSIGMGFAFPKGSALTANVSRAFLELQEDGEISQLYNKWFKSGENCPAVETAMPIKQVEPITICMDGYGGPVLILFLGLLVALLIAAMEVIVIKKRTQAYDVEEGKEGEQQPMLKEEEGQAVQYEEETKSNQDGQDNKAVEGDKEDEDKKEAVIKAEDADKVESAPANDDDDEDVKKPIPDSDDEEKKTEDDKKEESEEKNSEDKKEQPAKEDEPKEEGVKTEEEPSDEKPVDDEKKPSEEKEEKKDETEKEDSESKDIGTEKEISPDVKERNDLTIEEDQNKAEATS